MVPRVLVIDDDERLDHLVVEYLSGHGIEAVYRTDGTRGLASVKADHPNAVILDVMLPDGDGFDVLRELRTFSNVPVIMLTARGDEMDRIVGLEIGADDYLPKPFNPRELLARLKAIMRRTSGPSGGSQGCLRFGKLEIDLDARQVRVSGATRQLTGRQFELLVVLAKNAGKVMSREALMNRLTGDSWDVFDRSIDVHVSRIRAVIEDDPRNPERIKTVRGAGYVFSAAAEP